MNYNLEGSLKFIQTLAEDSKLKVRTEPTCRRPEINGRTLVMPVPTPQTIGQYEQEIHRLLSRRFKENHYLSKVKAEGKSEIVKDLISDYLADKSRRGVFLGRDKIREEGYSDSIAKLEMTGDEAIDGLIVAMNNGRNNWGENYNYLEDTDFSTSLEKKGFLDLLNSCEDEEGLEDLLRLVKTTEEESNEESEGSEEGEDGEDGDTEEGKGESEESSEGDNSDDSGDGQDESVDPDEESSDQSEDGEGSESGESEGETGSSEDDEGTTDEADPRGTDVSDEEQGEQGEQADISLAEIKKNLEDSGLLQPSENTKYNDRTPYIPVSGEPKIYNMAEYSRNVHSSVVERINNLLDKMLLTKKVKRYLMTISQSSYAYNLKTGRLNQKSIYKVATEPSPKIFKQRENSKIEHDSAIVILMDCSGSMGRGKYEAAASSCISISEVLQSLNIRHEIIGFTNEYKGERGSVVYYHFRHLWERVVPTEELVRRFSATIVRRLGNEDGSAVTYAIEKLLNQKQRSKTLIVLSDGQPTGEGFGNPKAYLSDIIQDVENQKVINIAAIGILSNAVERYYSNYTILEYVDEIEAALLGVIKNNIIR